MRSVQPLKQFHVDQSSHNLSIQYNRRLLSKCFYMQITRKPTCAWSNQTGKCDDCLGLNRQCFFFVDEETIRVMGA